MAPMTGRSCTSHLSEVRAKVLIRAALEDKQNNVVLPARHAKGMLCHATDDHIELLKHNFNPMH